MDDPAHPVADPAAALDEQAENPVDASNAPAPDPCVSPDPVADRVLLGVLIMGGLSGPIVLLVALVRWIATLLHS